jgi:ATP-binding cassette subfamily B protein
MLAALGLGAQRLLPLLQTVSHAFSSFRASGAIQRRIAEMLAAPDLVEGSPPPPLPFAEAIALEGVRFSYPDSAGLALTDVTLTIRRGERTALTGPNGSGKSTLADLVMGLLSPISGRVLVDGVELDPGTIRAWQRNVAHVPQAPFVSDANFVANIAFMDPDPDLARVGEAARLAGLEEVVASRPGGIESRVGEGGLMLSGGQRQRLALARALYAPAPLLVLDEATSALDLESEDQVLRALDALQERGTTILLIAHSDRMVRSCAKIVRMDQGRITAIVDGEGARDA